VLHHGQSEVNMTDSMEELEELGSPHLGRPTGLDEGGGNVAVSRRSSAAELKSVVERRSSDRFSNSISSSSDTTRHSFLTRPSIVQQIVGHEQDEVVEESGGDVKKSCGTKLCELQEKIPIAFVLGGAVIGIALGIGLAYWNPDDPSTKEVVIMWIGLIGDLFIRALKCIVMPLVFVSVTTSVMDMLSLGEEGTIIRWTIGLYVLTTVLAAAIGCITSVIFKRFYILADSVVVEQNPDVRNGCQTNSNGAITSYLTKQDDGSVLCMASALPLENGTLLFMLHDENGYFAKATPGLTTLTLSESIYQVRMIVRPSICVFSSSFTIHYLNVDIVVNTLQLQTGTIHATR
jgi:hypothetical protein